MKCPFCLSDLNYSSIAVYFCLNCKVEMTYICNGSINEPIIQYTQFYFDGYMIELNHDLNSCLIFYCPAGSVSCTSILSLNYLPIITPNNVEDWFIRIRQLFIFI